PRGGSPRSGLWVPRGVSIITVTPYLRRSAIMPSKRARPGKLPTKPVTKGQRVVLVESMQVTWKVLERLKKKGMLKTEAEGMVSLRSADGCCKPDGGTCCVNKK